MGPDRAPTPAKTSVYTKRIRDNRDLAWVEGDERQEDHSGGHQGLENYCQCLLSESLLEFLGASWQQNCLLMCSEEKKQRSPAPAGTLKSQEPILRRLDEVQDPSYMLKNLKAVKPSTHSRSSLPRGTLSALSSLTRVTAGRHDVLPASLQVWNERPHIVE